MSEPVRVDAAAELEAYRASALWRAVADPFRDRGDTPLHRAAQAHVRDVCGYFGGGFAAGFVPPPDPLAITPEQVARRKAEMAERQAALPKTF